MLTVNGSINAKVNVMQLDCIVQMLLDLCGVKYESDLGSVVVRDEGLYLAEDVSYHGSPTWEYNLISCDAKDIEAFKSLMILRTYYSNKRGM